MSDAAAEALEKVLARLDALEQKVDQVAGPLGRLSQPETAATLDRILERLDGLEAVVNTAHRMRTTMPPVTSAPSH